MFRDKVVIVTGASSGIGEATAREFARNGSKVVLAARSEGRLISIVNDIRSANGDAIYFRTDVSIEEDCKNLVQKTIEKYGTVDIRIHLRHLDCGIDPFLHDFRENAVRNRVVQRSSLHAER